LYISLLNSHKPSITDDNLVLCALRVQVSKGVRKGGWGLTPPLELDILQKLYYKGSV